jgi:hypothetical protein
MKKPRKNKPDVVVPKQPCYWCGRPLDKHDWVANGLGQLLHIDECFEQNWRSIKDASAREAGTNA